MIELYYANLNREPNNLQIHHAPQRHPAYQVIPGYNEDNSPAIALPDYEHWRIPNLRGPATMPPGELLRLTLENLTYSNTPPCRFRQLRDLMDQVYPGMRGNR